MTAPATFRASDILEPEFMRRVERAEPLRCTPEDIARACTLSPREREVLRRVALGQSSSEIAMALGSKLKTVQTQRTSAGRKIGTFNVASMTRFAVRVGMVEP